MQHRSGRRHDPARTVSGTGGLYQELAAHVFDADVPWQHVEVFFGDERDVPHDHVESNYHMAQRSLLDNVPISPQRVHPMPADAEDLQEAAREYEEIVRRIVSAGPDGVPQFDLILLGMGGDGHTASLFPRSEALDETKTLIVSQQVPVLGRNRMTFTFPLINAARHIVFLINGDDKAEAVAGMMSKDKAVCLQYPAARVRPKDGQLTIVLDAQAARQTSIRPQRL
ncbi:MAG: 6-phosphogluconolactonase [Planctomycetota bacterium]|jgi:6-phosphogluconolactonase